MSAPPGRPGGWRIIAADGNKAKLDALTGILRDAGHCVFPVQDGRSALELTIELPDREVADGAATARRRATEAGQPVLVTIARIWLA